MSNFETHFLNQLFLNVHKFEKNNWDYLRFSASHPQKDNFLVDRAVNQFSFILRNIDKFEYAFHLWKDKYSKELMLKLLQYNVLDHHHVRLPLNTEEYWEKYNMIDEKYLVRKNVQEQGSRVFNQYFLPEQEIMLIGTPLTILTQFILKQYFYEKNRYIRPEPGDIAFDAGGCRGDVAMHFAHAVGAKGHVHTFEFVPSNIEIMKKNFSDNHKLAGRISIVKNAISEKSGQKVYYEDRGPSTSIECNSTSNTFVETITIDDYFSKNRLHSVDFIKMDIEGSEEKALLGAKETIRKFTPKLAICVYHKPDDFYRIPIAIHKINPEYDFYLDHYTIHREETVLYAIKE